MRYSKERKEAVLRKMMPPQNRSIVELAKEEGIAEATLYNWRREARNRGLLLPDSDVGPEGWSARDKFNAVLESAALNEAELSEYCRKKGWYAEQLEQRPCWCCGKKPRRSGGKSRTNDQRPGSPSSCRADR